MSDRKIEKPGWQFVPGREMFPASRIAAFQRAYGEHMNIPIDSVVVTPFGHQPIAILPPPDNDGSGKLPPSLNIEWARHPMFWLDQETRTRYQDEDLWTWAIRIDIELTARNLYNPENGMCIDALKYFCGIDLDNPVDRLRLENYRDGGYDQLLSEFYIQRDPRLPFTEARQIAQAASKAFHESYRAHQEYTREGALARLDFEKAFIVSSPSLFEKALNELENIGKKLRLSSSTNSPEIIIPVKKAFSEHTSMMIGVLNDLQAYSASVNFVVILHTEPWTYQQEVERLLIQADEQEKARRAVVEDLIGVIYQQPSNEAHYHNLQESLKRWFVEIYHNGYTQVEQVNILGEKNMLFVEHNKPYEPTTSRVKIGREKWRIDRSTVDPFKDEQ